MLCGLYNKHICMTCVSVCGAYMKWIHIMVAVSVRFTFKYILVVDIKQLFILEMCHSNYNLKPLY